MGHSERTLGIVLRGIFCLMQGLAPQVLKEAMLRPSLQGNIFYAFDGTLGRSSADT